MTPRLPTHLLKSSRNRPTASNGPLSLLRRKSTVSITRPACDTRQMAQPIAFLSVKGWDKDGIESWGKWASLFAKAGYESCLVEVDPKEAKESSCSSKELLEKLEAELSSLLQNPSSPSPFPPLLISSHLSSLLSQTYVSSHPLSGLLLLSPTPVSALHSSHSSIFPTEVEEFNYEPTFPLGLILEDGEKLCERWEELKDEDEVRVAWVDEGDAKGKKGFQKCVKWMDQVGL
ncbi:hypothetical protein T439DRAFT_326955 [Meredithblackwellia eburnea MCA 4105]